MGSSSQTPCDAGKYCDEDGLEAPSGDCAPGYECLEGSDSATPYENGDQNYVLRVNIVPADHHQFHVTSVRFHRPELLVSEVVMNVLHVLLGLIVMVPLLR